MNHLGRFVYVPRYDNGADAEAAAEDVGELDFNDMAFPQQGGGGGGGVGRHGNRAGAHERNRIIDDDDDDDDDDDPLIFDLDLEDDGPRARSPVRHEEREGGGDDGLRGQNMRELAKRVARQERYIDHLYDQLNMRADRGRFRAPEMLLEAHVELEARRRALRTADQGGGGVQESAGIPIGAGDGVPKPIGLPGGQGGRDDDRGGEERGRQRRRGRGVDGGDGGGGEGGGGAAPQGPSLAARREVERDLRRMYETQGQLRWMGADPRELEEVDGEIRYLRDILAGRFAGPAPAAAASSSSSSPSSGGSGRSRRAVRRRQRKNREELGCYHGPTPLSDEDPRLPPTNVGRVEPVELYDKEGPRFLAFVTLDNPAPEARREEERVTKKANDMYKRYEAEFFTVIERALDSRALSVVSSGPRGVIWAIEAGREDVLGAMLRAREEPFGIMSWRMLGVGKGSSDRMVFCLHKSDDDEGGGGNDR